MSSPHLSEIDQHLARWTNHLRLRDGLLWALHGLLGGLAVGLGFSLVARLRPLYTVPTLLWIALGAVLVGVVLALALAYFWPRPRLAAARYFDRALGLQERTSAALELAHDTNAPTWLKNEQWADAVQAARRADPRRGVPLTLNRYEGLLCVLIATVLALSLYLPNPQQTVLASNQAVDKAIEEQIEKIEDAIEDIQSNPNLTEEQKDELTQPLEDALEQLKEGDLTQEQAVQVLTETQQELNAQSNPEAQAQANALQQAGAGLSENSTTKPVGDALQQGDLQSAAEALDNIDVSKLSAEEQAALADQLEKTAQQLAGTNPALAQELQAAADALRNGDTQAAQEALDRAADLMAQTASQSSQGSAASDAAGTVGEAQRAVAQAGDGQSQQGNGQGQNGQGQNGNGQGQNGNGQGQNGNGQGQNGNGQGNNGQGSSGAGTGEGNGDTSGGQAGNGTNGTNGGGSDGGERPYDEIYSPYHLGGDGDTVTLNGNGDPNGEVVGEGDTNPQNDGDVTVPYNEIFPYYEDAASDAIENGDVPLDLRDIIRDYFSSLNP